MSSVESISHSAAVISVTCSAVLELYPAYWVVYELVEIHESAFTDRQRHYYFVLIDLSELAVSFTSGSEFYSSLEIVEFEDALSLDYFEFLNEVFELASFYEVEAAGVELIDIYIFKPDQVFEVVTEAYLRGDSCIFIEMVDELVRQ